MADDPRAVLARIRERAEKAGDELDRLTEGRGPAANWRWSIPARPERDSDLLIGASQGDVPRMARALEAVLAVHEPEEQNYAGMGRPACGCGALRVEIRPNGEKALAPETYPCPTVRAITDALTTEETKP